MKDRTSQEKYLALAANHIKQAEERIRRQKSQLSHMTAQGQDGADKAKFITLLQEALDTMRRYQAQLVASLTRDGRRGS